MKKKWFNGDISLCAEVNTLRSCTVPGLSYSARQIVERFGLPPIESDMLTMEEHEDSPLFTLPLDKLDAQECLSAQLISIRESFEASKKRDIDALEARRLASVESKNLSNDN